MVPTANKPMIIIPDSMLKSKVFSAQRGYLIFDFLRLMRGIRSTVCFYIMETLNRNIFIECQKFIMKFFRDW